MLKSCNNKEFCGRNGWLEGDLKEAVPKNVCLRIVVDLEKTLNPVIKKLWEP